MENRKIRILGIAPYEGMKTIMQNIAKTREDLELDVYVGDLNTGVEIARRNFHSDYDVIISRGGTAQLIGQATSIPVIEVTLSVYDILRAIKLAENYADRYAIVGFPSITSCAHLLCDLLQYQIDIFTIHNAEEVEEKLHTLKKNGYRMILCDMIGSTIARRLGLNAILITSGSESISSAFDQAVKLSSSYASLKDENQFLSDMIHGSGYETVVLHADGTVFFSTLEGQNKDEFSVLLKREVPAILAEGSHKFFKTLDGSLYSFEAKKILFHQEPFAVFYFSKSSIPIATSKYGIQYTNRQEAEDHFFNSFFSITSDSTDLRTVVDHLSQSTVPVMIFGEEGSGKEQIMRMIYSQSTRKNNPLITVNCALLNDKSWNFLTNHYNSPFNDNGNTIFLSNLPSLPESRRKHLLSVLVDMDVCKRNRIIFSCVCGHGHLMTSEALEYVNTLACVMLYVPPLRDRADEIPTLASLYLNALNTESANQIIGFEQEALKLLQSYDWPCNYMQFKRILNELSLITTTPYIRTEHVASLLEKEKHNIAPVSSSPASRGLNFNRPLEEINRDIAALILKECSGNQSEAAKRLGISRTTLWRMLKNGI